MAAEDRLYPTYIPRDEEHAILAAADRVREGGASEAVLLYGDGGVGKTRLVRALAESQAGSSTTAWVRPMDIDDPEFWSLTNLQTNVARELDPVGEYFGRYTDHLSRLPATAGERVTSETMVSHFGHGRRIFGECYAAYLRGTGKAVVIVFDTVETIRGTSLLMILTQWMKSLPPTLFVLSGRPLKDGPGAASDPIEEELAGPYSPMPVSTVRLVEFTESAAAAYLSGSPVSAGLSDKEQAKLILLTRRHPLWLALAVSYLADWGVPEEVSGPLADIERAIPAYGPMTERGKHLHENFKRRLMVPYQETDFWHEAVIRLAAVRQSVNEPIWRQLMADRPLPEGVETLDKAWDQLLNTPWIRPRASRQFVTLHDAMAEELARRVIPVNDQSREWRQGLWARVVQIYDAQIAERETRYKVDSQQLESRRQLASESGRLLGTADVPGGEAGSLVRDAARLDVVKREIDQLKVSRFYNQLLADFTVGCRYFLAQFEQARRVQDLLFQDLLGTAMRRCMSASDLPSVVDDIDSGVIAEFRDWLAKRPGMHREIGIPLAEFMIATGQAEPAVGVLRELPLDDADAHQLSRQRLLLGNAYLRIPGQVKEGLKYLEDALAVAERADLVEVERQRLTANAYKELGFYYRSVGRWNDADIAYQRARNAMNVVRTVRKTNEDRSELASLQSNWAYVKGLGGYYHDGLSLVDSAIKIKEELGETLGVGISRSVQGEVYRYAQQFAKAWAAYRQAEAIFEEAHDQSWLGLILQEKAICLFQAYLDGVNLSPGTDPLAEARALIQRAADICRERAVRAYPSALNRAGRIIGHQDADEGLRYLAEGISQGRDMSDGWFWLANLVEYVELSYREWARTGLSRYRDGIARYDAELREATAEYKFPDLLGRWEIVRAHLSVHDWETSSDFPLLEAALQDYTEGFLHIAERGHVGSSGYSAIPGASRTFADLLRKLPVHVQAQWLEHLRTAWTGPQPGSTMLLAELEKLS